MKQLTILCISILFLYGCSKDDTNSGEPVELIELKKISVNIVLPENSSITENELTISSLFTEDSPIVNGSADIESFNDDSMELTFATNQQGNLVMLSYFNPLNNEDIVMNSETTAIALVMLHPWCFDLTANAKAEAIEYIRNLPEFESYKIEIENSLANGNLSPLTTNSVLDKVTDIQQITINGITEYIEPIQFNIQNSTVSVKNVKSSATYSVGLYDDNDVLFEHKPIQGLEKSQYLLQEFKNNIFQETTSSQQTATFNIPTDGNWTLKAKSGLSFDGSLENQQAAYYNTKTVVANVLGVFSTKLKTLIFKNECFIALGENVYNGVSGSIDISESIQSYSNGTITGYELTKDVLSFCWDRFDNILGIIENCSNENTELYGLDKIKSGVFGKVLGFFNVLSNLENVYNSTAMLTDWILYDKEIEFCFNKNGSEIQSCEEIDLSGNWLLNTDFDGQIYSAIISFNENNNTININIPDLGTSSFTLVNNNLNIQYTRLFSAGCPTLNIDVPYTETYTYITSYSGNNTFTGTSNYEVTTVPNSCFYSNLNGNVTITKQ